MNGRQMYALTHPLDEAHMDRIAHCRRARQVDDRFWCVTILAVDR